MFSATFVSLNGDTEDLITAFVALGAWLETNSLILCVVVPQASLLLVLSPLAVNVANATETTPLDGGGAVQSKLQLRADGFV